LHNFFAANHDALGGVSVFERPHCSIVVRVAWPLDLQAAVKVDCRATAPAGPLVTNEIISGSPADWRLEHMSWQWIALPARK
jgi:hypothetical protein